MTQTVTPTIGRQEWAAALGGDLKPGDHVSCLGPTGRGKSVAIGQLVAQLRNFDVAALLCPKGRDPAYEHLGGRSVRQWPPRASLGERVQNLMGVPEQREDGSGPRIYRVEVPIRSLADLTALRNLYGQVLASVLARPEKGTDSMFLVADDARFIADPRSMNLEAYLRNGLILGRSKRVSMCSNVQRPAFVPREILDQATHVLIWRNRDRDVAKRLTEISGAIDPKELEATIGALDYHSFIHVNGRTDTWQIVGAD